MKRTLVLLLLIGLFTGQAQENEEMLLGKISLSDLQKGPYSDWFVSNFEKYKVKDAKAGNLKNLLEGVDIKIFMGTWCSDSQREVPRFYKIMNALGYPLDGIELFALDREKTGPDNLEKGFDIQRVPTFIFYKDGEALGRIVEYPIESLETDMMKILSGKAYQHAYAE
ncbi:MAG: thioredoxin family protein [Pricia sp.]